MLSSNTSQTSSQVPVAPGASSAPTSTQGGLGYDTDSSLAWVAKAFDAGPIYTVLSTIALEKDQIATVNIERDGVRFQVEEMRSLQADVRLTRDLFHVFEVHESVGDVFEPFCINLSVLLDCLSVFGSQSSGAVALSIFWSGHGHKLNLMLLDPHNTMTQCSIATLVADDPLDFNFTATTLVAEVIIKSQLLHEAFHEMDWNSSHVTLLLSPELPHFRLSTSSPSGAYQVEYPQDQDVFFGFKVSQLQQYTYKLDLLKPSLKALNVATRTKIRLNEQGMLALTHMIPTDEHVSFVSFWVVPQVDESVY